MLLIPMLTNLKRLKLEQRGGNLPTTNLILHSLNSHINLVASFLLNLLKVKSECRVVSVLAIQRILFVQSSTVVPGEGVGDFELEIVVDLVHIPRYFGALAHFFPDSVSVKAVDVLAHVLSDNSPPSQHRHL